jgi:hypothetical protein
MRHGGGRLVAIDGEADKLGAGAGERRDLLRRRLDIGRVRIGHGLDDDGRAAADLDGSFAGADPDANGMAAGQGTRLVGLGEGESEGRRRFLGDAHAVLGLLERRLRYIRRGRVAIMTLSVANSGEQKQVWRQGPP